MYIQKLVIKNFKKLRDITVELNEKINIIVGDNETGKSTILDAIYLALTCQVNGRNIRNELTPYFFNNECVQEYFKKLRNHENPPPPKIVIEVYLNGDGLGLLKGTNNSLSEDCPGLKIEIDLNEDFRTEYDEYVRASGVSVIPIEYFKVSWYSFAHNPVMARSLPIKSTLIDTSVLRAYSGTERYLSQIIENVLSPKQQADLSNAFRKLKDTFSQEAHVLDINTHLEGKDDDISDKKLSVSLDVSSSWENSLVALLEEIPFSLSGKGEQSCIKMKLAMNEENKSNVFLIEEPENHLSYPKMSMLIGKMEEKLSDKQLILTTHSSFVLNKLGIDNVILLGNNGKMAKLNHLSDDTKRFFMKLPGHQTLRLVLCKRAILVEGASDELIVQKAYFIKHNKAPLQDGIDVITVAGLSFKRFLDIAKLLDIHVNVVTDNDGNWKNVEKKYSDYGSDLKIKIWFSKDDSLKTLEPQLVQANQDNLLGLQTILNSQVSTTDGLCEFMQGNKTECALRIFENAGADFKFPEYIQNAITF